VKEKCRKHRKSRKADAPQQLFRIPEAVGYLDGVVTVKTIRGWILRRQIDFVKLGGRVCIARDILDQLIERGRVPARTADSMTAPRRKSVKP
jgi:excisionase family DNA binding protein